MEIGAVFVLSHPLSHPWLSLSWQEITECRERLSDGLLRAWSGLPEVWGEWWCLIQGRNGIWQHQPGLPNTGRSYSLGRTADSLEAACGLTAPVSVIVCKYCGTWDPTDLRTLGISRAGLFAPRIVAVVIIMAV